MESGRVRGTGFQKVRKEMAVGEMGGYFLGGSVLGGLRGPRGGSAGVTVEADFFLGGIVGWVVETGIEKV